MHQFDLKVVLVVLVAIQKLVETVRLFNVIRDKPLVCQQPASCCEVLFYKYRVPFVDFQPTPPSDDRATYNSSPGDAHRCLAGLITRNSSPCGAGFLLKADRCCCNFATSASVLQTCTKRLRHIRYIAYTTTVCCCNHACRGLRRLGLAPQPEGRPPSCPNRFPPRPGDLNTNQQLPLSGQPPRERRMLLLLCSRDGG